jgi:hypothetical protein
LIGDDLPSRDREHALRMATSCYTSARARILLRLRVHARQGTLGANWRGNLSLRALALTSNAYGRNPTTPEAVACLDSEDLACHDVAHMELQLWEPCVATDWRTALDAWHAAVIDRLDYQDRNMRARSPFKLPLAGSADPVSSSIAQRIADSHEGLRERMDAERDRILGRRPRTSVRREPIPCVVGRSPAVRVVGPVRRCTA